MPRIPRCPALVALAIAALIAAGARAADTKETVAGDVVPPPKAAEVQALSAHPAQVLLRGTDSAEQLVVTATLAGGRLADLTGDVEYEVADKKLVRVLPGGRVMPLASGQTEIVARYGNQSTKVAVKTESIEENLPINFGNQIVPIFGKLGCNSGGCHGKASGQNGFKLSLFGFDADLDYVSLVKEARGRRVNAAVPDQSLLLLKAAGGMAHGGGKRMEPNSDEYRTIRRWIASGLPFGQPDDPVVTKISIFPEGRILPRNCRQQFAVYAHYSDGSVEDITRRAQYDSNDTDVAAVDGNGLVRTLALSGEAAVMARYQGQVTIFRATVPLGAPAPTYTFEPKTVVDKHTLAKWQQLGIVPSEPCSDEQFVRRAYLDITGTLPTPKQQAEFVADKSAAKRDRLVDRLLDTPEYSYYFANKWADILRVKRGNNQQNRAYGTFSFHGWIRDAMTANMPYDEFARDILAAVGDESRSPPTVWYKEVQTADQFVDNTSQVFLGTRMQCAQCHHHPYEKWSQDDYWGLAAFYGRVGTKNLLVPGVSNQGQQNQRRLIYTKTSGTVQNKRTNRTAVMKPLGGEPMDPDGDIDPRQKLVDWMVDAKNPFFARAVANRYWAHFFGRGIVDPLDDMRVTNPPSNPELLDALAQDLVEHKYSLKHLLATICKSRTYGLSSTPNEFNKNDKQTYSRYYPKRLPAEVLFDAVCQVTASPAQFNGLPQDQHAPNRAIMLPDESFQSYFLDVFGRPQRISACECERSTEANLAQALHLLNSEEVQGKIARQGGRADQLAKDPRPDAEKVEELFLWALGRKPSAAHLKLALENIEANGKTKKVAYENIVWALLNTKEFVFNR
jgi:hypothetical protein